VGALLVGCDSSKLRAGRILNGLTGLVPVEVPLEKLVVGVVQLGALPSSWDLSVVVTTGNPDVESLRPELAIANIAVVVNGDDLSPQDVVSAGNLRGDGDALRVAVVVEDSIGTPVASLALRFTRRVAAPAVVDERALVDFEEVQFGLVDVLAVAVAGSHVSGCPAVMGAVPALLIGAAATLVVPGELDRLASGGFDSVRGRGGIHMSNDVGAGMQLAHERRKFTKARGRYTDSACHRRWAGIPNPDWSTKQATCYQGPAWKPGGSPRRSCLQPRTCRRRCDRPRQR
jgi:hypothetical protein